MKLASRKSEQAALTSHTGKVLRDSAPNQTRTDEVQSTQSRVISPNTVEKKEVSKSKQHISIIRSRRVRIKKNERWAN